MGSPPGSTYGARIGAYGAGMRGYRVPPPPRQWLWGTDGCLWGRDGQLWGTDESLWGSPPWRQLWGRNESLWPPPGSGYGAQMGAYGAGMRVYRVPSPTPPAAVMGQRWALMGHK